VCAPNQIVLPISSHKVQRARRTQSAGRICMGLLHCSSSAPLGAHLAAIWPQVFPRKQVDCLS